MTKSRSLLRVLLILLAACYLPFPSSAQELHWTESIFGPSERVVMAFDSAREVTVAFDGLATWEWDGRDWIHRPVVTPSLVGSLAYDSARAVTVLVGFDEDTSTQETWEWDGATWTQRIADGPPAQIGHAMAYDAANVVLTRLAHQTAVVVDGFGERERGGRKNLGGADFYGRALPQSEQLAWIGIIEIRVDARRSGRRIDRNEAHAVGYLGAARFLSAA